MSKKYDATVSYGGYTFLNVKEAHAYALSVAKDKEDYIFRYLGAAGPQLIVWYSSKKIRLDLIFICSYSGPANSYCVCIDKVSPSVYGYALPKEIRLSSSIARRLGRNLGLPAIYTGRLNSLVAVVRSSYDYLDNNRYAKQLFLHTNLASYIIANHQTAPMEWHFKMPMSPVAISRLEMRNLVISSHSGKEQ